MGITVTTKKEYELTLSGTDGTGKKYSYTIYPETGGTIPDDRFKTFFARVRDAKDEYLVEPCRSSRRARIPVCSPSRSRRS